LGLGSIVDRRLSDGWTDITVAIFRMNNSRVICALLHRYGSGCSVGGDGLIGWGEDCSVDGTIDLIRAVVVIAVLTSVYCTE